MPVERENYYEKFETRMLRTGDDPSVYKWELEQLIEKADPKLAVEAKSALLSRQFMRVLPSSIRGKRLAHNPTPTLSEMLIEFCPTLSSDSRPRRPCTYKRKRINTQADSGHGPTRGFINDRTGNSTESA